MNILVLNPNTTFAMTDLVVEQLRRHLPSTANFFPLTASSGNAVISTQESFDSASITSVEMARSIGQGSIVYHAIVLACFGDPGLEAMRKAVSVPVVGLASASMQKAEQLLCPYSVITAGSDWQQILSKQFANWGASPLFKGVEILGVTGMEVLKTPLQVLPDVAKSIEAAKINGAQNVILGGAVLAGYKEVMRHQGMETTGIVDCVESVASALLSVLAV